MNTIIILILIGIAAGILSGFVGIGGGVVIVPALIYFFGMTQMQAQGTSLFLMLPPIGILAVMNYYKTGNVNIWYGIIIAGTFVIGGYFGSKISLRLSPNLVKIIFGTFMLYVAFKMIVSGWKGIQSE
ncbi:MAG: sulfite exporter TauE/SafE family protein [Crocinitomicaceae bacterium]|nr:sulfite exporter TauE/SafE family protein [Crocinitomicaceae bacterium]